MIIYAMMMRSSGDDEVRKEKRKRRAEVFLLWWCVGGIIQVPQEVWHQVSGMRYGTKERELYKIQF